MKKPKKRRRANKADRLGKLIAKLRATIKLVRDSRRLDKKLDRSRRRVAILKLCDRFKRRQIIRAGKLKANALAWRLAFRARTQELKLLKRDVKRFTRLWLRNP